MGYSDHLLNKECPRGSAADQALGSFFGPVDPFLEEQGWFSSLASFLSENQGININACLCLPFASVAAGPQPMFCGPFPISHDLDFESQGE